MTDPRYYNMDNPQEREALARANDACGLGPYTQRAYIEACQAAPVPWLEDDQAAKIVLLMGHFIEGLNRFILVSDLEEHIDWLGSNPATAIALAVRRVSGLAADPDVRARRVRELMLDAGESMVTDDQIKEIQHALERNKSPVYIDGPTRRAQIGLLFADEAERYLEELYEYDDE